MCLFVLRTGLLAALFLFWATWAEAQGKRVALLIGNERYQHERVLVNPVRDVKLLAQVLRDDLRFDLVRAEHNLNLADMDRVIREFAGQARGASTVLFYFAGHGLTGSTVDDPKTPFLLPTDARSGAASAPSLEYQAISVRSIRDRLRGLGAPVTLMFLDACRDGPGMGRSGSRGLARVGGGPRLLLSYATEEGRIAEDGDPARGEVNSPYAAALAQAWRRTDLTVLQQMDLVHDAVVSRYPNQTPIYEGSMRADARLSPFTPVSPAEQLRLEDEAWALCRNGRTVIPCQQYIEGWPQGRYASLARTRIRDLEATAAPAAQVPAAVAATPGLTVGQVIQDCDVCPKLVVLPAGRFRMGSMDGDPDERPVREVSVAGFLMGQTEVTQGQWRAVMGSNPSHFTACGDDCPVERVSWEEAQAYVKKLSERTGKVYRLPSEAEWEYAARAGSRTQWSFGDDEAKLGEHGWFNGNSGRNNQRVATRRPNGWGLYDMHGNVWEWVQDVWHDDYTSAPTDGRAWMAGGDQALRVLRGGSWGNSPRFLRSAFRYGSTPANRINDTGFRIARTF